MDSRELARDIRRRVAQRAEQFTQAVGTPPCLATVLVGSDPGSVTYAKMKRKRCLEVVIDPRRVELPAGTTTDQIIREIQTLATDETVHGILLQHPVPKPIDKRAAFEAIPIAKDIDGVSSAGLGRTILGMPAFSSCTPRGIMTLLEAFKVEMDGAHAVVLGRSPILGRPMASMLINAHATVTLCHSRTREQPSIVRHADILIVAVGRPRLVQGDWIKPGAVVIDAGYNEGNIGDVDFEAAIERASLITPVPGGVGPMTIATLLSQTVDAAAQQRNLTI